MCSFHTIPTNMILLLTLKVGREQRIAGITFMIIDRVGIMRVKCEKGLQP